MNESIRVRFTRDGSPLPINHLDSSQGLVLGNETSAQPLGFGIGLAPGSPVTKFRMGIVRQNEDWIDPKWNLTVTRDDDSLVITGGGKRDPKRSLPPGSYDFRFLLSETKLRNGERTIDIPENGQVEVVLDEAPSAHQVFLVSPASWDPETLALCRNADSMIDSMDLVSWLQQPLPRIARKACLLNLLAKARALPSARPNESFCGMLESIRYADVDRINAKVRPTLLPKLRSLLDWRDSSPIHPSHAAHMATIFGGKPSDYHLESFREGASLISMQIVVATHATTGAQFAELDIDLGNPSVDLTGLVCHVGELIDPGRTDHLGLYSKVRDSSAKDFLYYSLDQPITLESTAP